MALQWLAVSADNIVTTEAVDLAIAVRALVSGGGNVSTWRRALVVRCAASVCAL